MFAVLGVNGDATPPAKDVTPTGAVVFTAQRCNTIEISGRVSAGTGKLYILRKLVYTGHYHFRPWTEDRPADSADFVSGYFSMRLRVRQDSPIEEIILWNPSGALTIDSSVPVLATACNY